MCTRTQGLHKRPSQTSCFYLFLFFGISLSTLSRFSPVLISQLWCPLLAPGLWKSQTGRDIYFEKTVPICLPVSGSFPSLSPGAGCLFTVLSVHLYRSALDLASSGRGWSWGQQQIQFCGCSANEEWSFYVRCVCGQRPRHSALANREGGAGRTGRPGTHTMGRGAVQAYVSMQISQGFWGWSLHTGCSYGQLGDGRLDLRCLCK